ncbi:MAG TPA: hypothetical protein VFU98_15910 [Microlunatus sp.]|nr:hypothetical protein [Microlunatus sp.]
MAEVRQAAELVAQGFGHGELARCVRAGDLRRIRRGAYAWGREPEELEDAERHRELIEASIPVLADEAVVSHTSAAVLHGLPTWRSELQRVHVIRDRDHGGRIGGVVHVHPAPLPDDQVVVIGGRRVTSLARTVVDVGCRLSLFRSVPLGDAALAQGLDPRELSAVLAGFRRRHGAPRARRMVSMLDARSESVGESCSRVTILQCGLPVPELQFEVFDPAGFLIGRSDFYWRDQRTLGEFDGQVKYGRLLQPGQDIGTVVTAEKEREDRLRDEGLHVVRWTWTDLARPEVLRQRIRRALERGTRLA